MSSFMNKERKPIFQPNELSNATVVSMRTRIISAIVAIVILLPAVINLDFADVKTIMSKKGPAMIGFGIGKGANRAQEAAIKAINSPLLEHSIQGANSAIVSNIYD